MKTVRSVAELHLALNALRADRRNIGLVPTMGALHAGHLSLIDRSVDECDHTVLSIFVNPTQFGPDEDLERYPRQFEQDSGLAFDHGVDLLFAPRPDELYPDGFATSIVISGITETLCGDRDRRGREHFDGVAIVVAKLFNMVAPDRAYFGQKDAQQVAVIRRLVRDLDFRVEVISCPTIRDADGLAMSSRNAYLSPADRERGLSLIATLRAADRLVAGGETDATIVAAAAAASLVPVDAIEYFELVDPDTLAPVRAIDRPVLAAIAARVGSTRLIDNLILEPKAVHRPGRRAELDRSGCDAGHDSADGDAGLVTKSNNNTIHQGAAV